MKSNSTNMAQQLDINSSPISIRSTQSITNSARNPPHQHHPVHHHPHNHNNNNANSAAVTNCRCVADGGNRLKINMPAQEVDEDFACEKLTINQQPKLKCQTSSSSSSSLSSNVLQYFLAKLKKRFLYIVYFVVYNIFFSYAVHRSWDKSESYCEGVKLLSVITIIVYMAIIYAKLLKPYCLLPLWKRWTEEDCYCPADGGSGGQRCSVMHSVRHQLKQRQKVLRVLCWLAVLAFIATLVGSRAAQDKQRLFSIGGYFLFILLGFVFSKHRSSINWNQILWGFTIQIVFGIVVLRTELGKTIFGCIGDKINTFLSFTKAGTEMVFGYLATGILRGPYGQNVTVLVDETHNYTVDIPELPMTVQNSIFAMSGMPVVIFFSFVVSILYHYGIMQAVVKKFGWLLQSTIGTTACESISASGNIFLGMTESPLLIKPFLPVMTKSELHAVLTGGFATIAGSVMAAYISFGISATHLLSASVMAAPSALALSKLLYPETEPSQTSVEDIELDKGSERNAIEAGSNGASSAIGLISNIIANLIAFIAFITFLDSIIGWLGEMVEIPQLSFKFILSKMFIPVAMMIGVEWDDVEDIAGLIGLKMVINEFVAYQELANLTNAHLISKRSETIATFALCGFANLGSIGIQVGGLSALAPTRKSDLAEISFRAMVTGSMACFMTACVSGMLI